MYVCVGVLKSAKCGCAMCILQSLYRLDKGVLILSYYGPPSYFILVNIL